MSKSKPSQEERNRRRVAHKGWLIQALTADRCNSIIPQTFTAKRLAELGYPVKFVWPEFEDFDGAKVLIELVMARDIDGIQRLKLRHPMADFGLDDWMAGVLKEQALADNITRTPIKSPKNGPLYKDYRLEHFIQVDSNDKTESIVAVIFKGSREVASKTLASRNLT